jgi:hypothetical protein
MALSVLFAVNCELQAHLSYVAGNNRLRTMYKFTSTQATNNLAAFFSKPR